VRSHWAAVAWTTTLADGTYTLRIRPHRPGSYPVRVSVGPVARLVGRLNAYHVTYASWYGPGLYGGALACGGTLSWGTRGVASRTLPCGTEVTFRNAGHTVRVPVVDRGPFVAGRDWDLTGATRDALHFGSTGPVLATG
jgi:rare lipoprotein A (peptidoglycan hydrolase)